MTLSNIHLPGKARAAPRGQNVGGRRLGAKADADLVQFLQMLRQVDVEGDTGIARIERGRAGGRGYPVSVRVIPDVKRDVLAMQRAVFIKAMPLRALGATAEQAVEICDSIERRVPELGASVRHTR